MLKPPYFSGSLGTKEYGRLLSYTNIFDLIICKMLYKEASRILQSVSEKKGTIKNLVLTSKFKNKKQLYALVCESQKYKSVLLPIIESTKIRKHEKILRQEHLALVLAYDLLLGKGLPRHDDKFKEAILKHKAALNSELARLKVRVGAKNNEDLLPKKIKSHEKLPRYVRVNTLKASVKDVIEHFRSENFHQMATVNHYDSYISAVASLKEKQFVQDPHVPCLLVFAPKTDLHDHVLYENGSIIFQDKASCLPAHILSPPPGSHVIDSCAAPGNKTTHLAALLNNKGKLLAFDKDMKRLSTMNTMMIKAGVLCADTMHGDFLDVSPTDERYGQVEYILVDPSCSGSGIVDRLNEATDDDKSSSKSRLQKLASFQIAILTHALTFPSVKRVVYSTCSIHQQENEQVVSEALRIVENKFKLVSVLKEFPSRGLKLSQSQDEMDFDGRKCLRTDPKNDLCNGFFVACLEKKKGAVDIDLVKIRSKNLKRNNKSVEVEDAPQRHTEDEAPSVEKNDVGEKTKKRKLDKQEANDSPTVKVEKQTIKLQHKKTSEGHKTLKGQKTKKNEQIEKKTACTEGNTTTPTGPKMFQQVSNKKLHQGKYKKKHKKHKPVTC